MLSPHLLQTLRPTLPVPTLYRGRARPSTVLTGLESPSPPRGGPSADQMSREGTRLSPILRNRRESTQLPKGRRKSPEKGCQARRPRRTGSHRLCFEPYFQLRPRPPVASTPLPRQWRRLSAVPPLLSVRPAALCTDWLYRPEGSQGSPQQQRVAPAPGRQSRKCPHVTPRTQSSQPSSAAFPT